MHIVVDSYFMILMKLDDEISLDDEIRFSENVYKRSKIVSVCNHRLIKKLVYGINNDLKHITGIKDIYSH